jgi:hypothetical protein
MFRTKLFTLIAAAAGVAAAQIGPVPVPGDLQPPAGNVAYAKGYAVGTQNYICLPSASGLAWKLQGPQATVFLKVRWFNTDVLQQIITHFLSPNPKETGTPARATWQSSIDTSATWAKKIAESTDAAYVAPGAIPWFLLQAVGGQAGPTGGTLLSRTTYIQRVNTTGGTVQTAACMVEGDLQFVPYTAEYVFYQPGGSH